MGKFKNKLYSFMYGRYSTDTLGKTLLWTYIVLILINMVLSLFIRSWIFKVSYFIISLLLIFFIFFRMFSRNVTKRRRENEKFCGFFRLIRNKFRDRKTHVYRKCPSCHAILRLTKAKGKHSVVCPRCKKRFDVHG